MVLTEIGEVGLERGPDRHLLRPSLYAMTRIGTPEEIVRVFCSVMADFEHPDKLGDALVVIRACCEDDLTDVFGFHEIRDGRVVFVEGESPTAVTLIVARHLITHGVVGALPALPERPGQEHEYAHTFDARAHAALAMAHLGVPSRDAWVMTMTELVGALRAKFPPAESTAPGAQAPSKAEMEATLDWHDKILAATGGA